jgi:hypothetical protein
MQFSNDSISLLRCKFLAYDQATRTVAFFLLRSSGRGVASSPAAGRLPATGEHSYSVKDRDNDMELFGAILRIPRSGFDRSTGSKLTTQHEWSEFRFGMSH